MPNVSLETQVGGQLIFGYQSISQPWVEFLFLQFSEQRPRRMGWGWILVRENSDFTRIREVWSGPIYSPGSFIMFPSTYGFDGFQYGVYVDWNVGGLPVNLYYE